MLQEVKNILFDLGGVLIDLDKQRCIDAFTAIGFPQIEKLIDLYHPVEIFNRLERGEITGHDVSEYIRAQSQNSSISDQQIEKAYQAFLADLPVEKLRLITRLRKAGLHTYLLSNTNAMVWEEVEAKFIAADGHPIDSYFDKMYLSYQLHDLKPAPSIFEKVIADSGICPEQTLFIDDGEKNILTAAEMGFHVYMPQPREDFSHLFDELLKA